jgi:hypothetical protein
MIQSSCRNKKTHRSFTVGPASIKRPYASSTTASSHREYKAAGKAQQGRQYTDSRNLHERELNRFHIHDGKYAPDRRICQTFF